MVAKRLAQEPNLNPIFERVGLFEVLEIRFLGLIALRFYIFSLYQQKAPHLFHILRQARHRAGDHGNHERQRPQSDE